MAQDDAIVRLARQIEAARTAERFLADNGGIPSVTEPDQTGGSYYLFSPSCSLYTCSFGVAKDMWEMSWGALVPSAGVVWNALNVYDSTDTTVVETITLNYTSKQPGGAFGPSTYAVQYNSTPGQQPITGAPDLIQSGQIQPAFEVPWIDGTFDAVEFQANNALAQSNALSDPTAAPDPSSGSLLLLGIVWLCVRRWSALFKCSRMADSAAGATSSQWRRVGIGLSSGMLLTTFNLRRLSVRFGQIHGLL